MLISDWSSDVCSSDLLVRDRIEAIVINDIFPRHCGWRRQIVDELQKANGIENLRLDVDRAKHRRHRLPKGDQLLVADLRALRNAKRNENAVRTEMKGRVRRQTRPPAAPEIIGAVLTNPPIENRKSGVKGK